MKYLLYLLASILLLTSCRKVTYTPFLKTNLALTSASEPQKYLSAHADSSGLQTPLVAEPLTANYITKPPLLSHKELDFPVLQEVQKNLLTRKVIHQVNKLQKREKQEPDPRKLEPLAVISTALAGLSLPLLLLQTGLTAFILLNVAAIGTGIISVTKIRRNKSIYKGKGWAITGISLGIYLLVGTLLMYLLIRNFVNSFFR